MPRTRRFAILGAGPVGLCAALRARQLGYEVELYTSSAPARVLERVECVPFQFVALLIELGINPRLVGIDRTHEQRRLQWVRREPTIVATTKSVHVGRPALEIALLKRAARAGVAIAPQQNGSIEVLIARHRTGDAVLLDATGRSAVTAIRKIKPKKPLIARLFSMPVGRIPLDRNLMLAAGAQGYVYRVTNATTVAFGIVGQKQFVQGDRREVLSRIDEFAPWIMEGLKQDELSSGASGAASAQWTLDHHENTSILIGDAAFARDALASQGLINGMCNALNSVSFAASDGRAVFDRRPRAAVAQHCTRLIEQIGSSPFGAADDWIQYTRFLNESLNLQAATKAPVPV